MEYMMFVTTDPEAAADETGEGTLDIETWVNTYDAAGKRVLGERLRPVEDSTTVRRRGGKVMVTDGPFAESRVDCLMNRSWSTITCYPPHAPTSWRGQV
jgi:hypothetical protein